MRGGTAGLVLAAGGGRRLGGRPKALLEVGGRSLAERAVAVLSAAGCDPVRVVIGAHAERVRARLTASGAGPREIVVNPGWEEGMGSSLRVGLNPPPAAEAVLVMLVDQPGIGAAAAARVIAAGREAPGGLRSALVTAGYGGKRGHPVLLGAEHLPGVVASARGDRGARAYLAEHADRVRIVECSDVADPADIDTPEDLRRALAAGRPAAPRPQQSVERDGGRT
ncbi:nucleotidyltransferase family protein [Streptomyces calidiresistens]|uniref:NTP transferase domain-containing protein n=1 Tax=Streptomyces calidiresistens TaxID=1485586 RepID=A0A7W3XVV8_9ACTN|nr:nucleotidyltransferase family protein [Streptomyces calidiresistens]MBB0229224.1 NTP transferase domain-containing protein [Streptomyces calidiresistens]